MSLVCEENPVKNRSKQQENTCKAHLLYGEKRSDTCGKIR